MTTLKIGYFGDGPWAHRALERLHQDASIEVVFICARYQRPDEFLRKRADEHRIEFVTHRNISSDEFLDRIAPLGSDLFVSMSFDQIFRRHLFSHPRLGTINCHAGKLPFYRGRNVLNWALINDEKAFGITVHYVDEGIDTGDIIAQRDFPITDADNYASLLERAYAGCSDLLYETVKQLQLGAVSRTRQKDIHPLGFYCTARKEGDERLDWNQTSRDVFNFVRAICKPGPEARAYLGDTEIRINRVEFFAEAPVYRGIPGAILAVLSDGFLVKTFDTYVKVTEWSGATSPRIGARLT